MESRRFDTLTRLFGSRRSVLGSLLGGAAALAGLTSVDETAAHDAAARCRTLADPATRRRCLKRARAHNRRHRCKPKSPATFCGGRCSGTAVDNCGKQITCPSCPAGRTCLGNNSCSRTCSVLGEPGACPSGCRCGILALEGGVDCIPTDLSCDNVSAQLCLTSAQCPIGFFCGAVACGSGGNGPEGRCLPICPL